MKIAIVVSTPYHLLNALNIRFHILKDTDQVDVFFQAFSPYMRSLLEELKKTQLFQNYYCWNAERSHEPMEYHPQQLNLMYRPKKFLPFLSCDEGFLKGEPYDELYITIFNDMEFALSRIYPNAKIKVYDDGLGTYLDNVFHDGKGRFFSLIGGLRAIDNKPIECLYVNNASACHSSITSNVIELPSMNSFSEHEREMVRGIFLQDKPGLHGQYSRIYLTMPYTEIPEFDQDVFAEMENVILSRGEDVLVRVHPRDHQVIELPHQEDDSGALWELVCADAIRDDHVLISIFSTAQFTPKMLYGKEPYVVFLYKLLGIGEDLGWPKLVDSLRESYRDQEKILVPADVEELKRMLEEIGQKS